MYVISSIAMVFSNSAKTREFFFLTVILVLRGIRGGNGLNSECLLEHFKN